MLDLRSLSEQYEAGESIELVALAQSHDPNRRFIFLSPLGLPMSDVLLHQEVLVLSGILRIPPEGATIRCLVKKEEKGPKAVKVLQVDWNTQAAKSPIISEFGPEPMKVKFFRADKDFGFFTRDDGVDVFVHIETVKHSGISPSALVQGAEFKVTYKAADRGFQVTKIM